MAMFTGAPIQVFKRYLFGSVFTGAPMQPFYPVQYTGYTYPLDGLSVSSSAALSTRKLRSAYTGKAMNVRRSSDNATQDIGFVNGVLDTASLLAFVGAGNGFVTTWYDQSGNGFNVTQATAVNQPSIVSAGVVNVVNLKPAVLFNGTSQYLQTSSNVVITMSAVNGVAYTTSNGFYPTIMRQNATASGSEWALRSQTNTGNLGFYSNTGAGNIFGANNSLPLSAAFIVSGTFNSSSGFAYANGTQIATATTTAAVTTTGLLAVGCQPNGGSNFWGGSISETTAFSANLSTADRQSLERNQEAFYSITGV